MRGEDALYHAGGRGCGGPRRLIPWRVSAPLPETRCRLTYCVLALSQRPAVLYREHTEEAAQVAMRRLLCPAAILAVEGHVARRPVAGRRRGRPRGGWVPAEDDARHLLRVT
jgi:hypothetical protein